MWNNRFQKGHFIPFRPYPTFLKINGKPAKPGRNPQNDELQYAWGKELLGNTGLVGLLPRGKPSTITQPVYTSFDIIII